MTRGATRSISLGAGADDDVLRQRGRIFIGETSEFGFCQFADHGWLRGTGQWFRVQLISTIERYAWPSTYRKHTHARARARIGYESPYTYLRAHAYTTRIRKREQPEGRVAPRIIIIFVISWHSTRRAHQSENRINQLSHSRPNSKQEEGKGAGIWERERERGKGWLSRSRVSPCLVKYHLIPREIRFNFTRHNTPATVRSCSVSFLLQSRSKSLPDDAISRSSLPAGTRPTSYDRDNFRILLKWILSAVLSRVDGECNLRAATCCLF